jgi:hypothetical protein
MDDQTRSFWWKFWGRPLRFFIWLTVISIFGMIGFGIYWQRLDFSPHFSPTSSFRAMLDVWGFIALFLMSSLALILSAIPWTRPAISWALRRWFFCIAVLATLIALFYAEEDWRGKRAWEREKAHLEAMGLSQNWEDYIPPAVPDDQNIFKAPKMQEWFVGRSGSNEFTGYSTNRNSQSVGSVTNAVVTEAQARDYLAWSDQLAPKFDLIREALKRPYARMAGDYSQPVAIPIPNFVAVREMGRILGERAHCYFVLHQPDQALEQLTLIHDMRPMLEGAPTGKPMTLVAAMINVAVVGLYTDVIGEGFKLHAWQEPQLIALEKQLGDIRLAPLVAQAFRHTEVSSSTTLERSSRNALIKLFLNPGSDRSWLQNRVALFLTYAPRGWFYQNMVVRASLTTKYFDRVDPTHESVSPSRQKEMTRSMETVFGRISPYNLLVAIFTPNFSKATQVMGHNQNSANMAIIACALERYHLANNQYPESLAALTPQFIDKLPHDIINGGELKYRKTNDTFVLYSIGWNEKDDGGTPATVINGNGPIDLDHGDWVWPYAPQH